MANSGLASTGCKAGGEPCRAIGLSDNGERRNVHLAISPATSDIRAVEFIPSRDGDCPVQPDLLTKEWSGHVSFIFFETIGKRTQNRAPPPVAGS